MSTIKIDVLEVNQNIGNIYVGKINAHELYKLAKADIRRIVEGQGYEGIQRPLVKARIEAVKKYLSTSFATFPNSIILNLDSDHIESSDATSITIKCSEKVFSIIDGQHRLAGFEKPTCFEVIISIFIDLDISNQAMIFKTINSEQQKVDPSLKIDLENFNKVDTPEKVTSRIAYAFNIDPESPWYQSIKLTGNKDSNSEMGIISQKAFNTPIFRYIYDPQYYYTVVDMLSANSNDRKILLGKKELRKAKHILWDFYINTQEMFLYKILFNYFKVFKNIFSEEWGKSLITKTTGYNAMMKLFGDAFSICKKNGDFSYESFSEVLGGLKNLVGKMSREHYGASGDSAAEELYKDMKKYL